MIGAEVSRGVGKGLGVSTNWAVDVSEGGGGRWKKIKKEIYLIYLKSILLLC